MRILPGEIVLSEKDVKRMEKKIIDGKIKYVIPMVKHKTPKINKEDFEKQILAGASLSDLMKHFNTTTHYILKFTRDNYKTQSLKTTYRIIEEAEEAKTKEDN